MRADRFLDTNVLIYAFSDDPRRGPIAEQLLADGGGVSVQVLNEFANVCRKKLQLEWREIGARLGSVRALLSEPASLTAQTHERALEVARRYKLSFYDALIVAAATEMKCKTILSEDMQAGASFAGVKIRNPFL
jgi:predicted nucleic acid-binding protein